MKSAHQFRRQAEKSSSLNCKIIQSPQVQPCIHRDAHKTKAKPQTIDRFGRDAVVFDVPCWIPERCLFHVPRFSVFLQGVIFIASPSTVGRKPTSAEGNTVRAAAFRTLINKPNFHFLQFTQSTQISARSNVYHKTIRVLQLLEKFPTFCGTQSKFIIFLAKARNECLFWTVWTQSMIPHY